MSIYLSNAKGRIRNSDCLVSSADDKVSMSYFKDDEISYLSIGNKIVYISGTQDAEDYSLSSIGRRFVEYYQSKHGQTSLVEITRGVHTRLGDYGLYVLMFISEDFEFANKTLECRPVKISEGQDAECVLRYYHRNRAPQNGVGKFMAEYAYVRNSTFVYIESLVSIKPGAGKKLLKKIIDNINCPILVKAGYIMYGDYKEYEETGDKSVLNKLVDYYEGLGFTEITDEVGGANEASILKYSK